MAVRYQILPAQEARWKRDYLMRKLNDGVNITRYAEQSLVDLACSAIIFNQNIGNTEIEDWIKEHLNPDLEIKLRQAIRRRRKRSFNNESLASSKKMVELEYGAWTMLASYSKKHKLSLSAAIVSLLSSAGFEALQPQFELNPEFIAGLDGEDSTDSEEDEDIIDLTEPEFESELESEDILSPKVLTREVETSHEDLQPSSMAQLRFQARNADGNVDEDNESTSFSVANQEQNLAQAALQQEQSKIALNVVNKTVSSMVREFKPSDALMQRQLEQQQVMHEHQVVAPPKRRTTANGIPPLEERYELAQLQANQAVAQPRQLQAKKSEGDYERVPYFEDFYPDDFEEVVYLDEEE